VPKVAVYEPAAGIALKETAQLSPAAVRPIAFQRPPFIPPVTDVQVYGVPLRLKLPVPGVLPVVVPLVVEVVEVVLPLVEDVVDPLVEDVELVLEVLPKEVDVVEPNVEDEVEPAVVLSGLLPVPFSVE
jgi:hypothetical protein